MAGTQALLPSTIALLSILFLLYFVASRAPRTRLARWFLALLVMDFVSYFSVVMALFGELRWLVPVTSLGGSAAYVMHLYVVFLYLDRPRIFVAPPHGWKYYLVFFAAAVLPGLFDWGGAVVVALVLVPFFAAVYLLFMRFRRAPLLGRRQAGVLLASTVLVLMTIIVVAAAIEARTGLFMGLSSMLVIASAALMGYGLLYYQLFDLSLQLRAAAVTYLGSLLLAGLFTVVQAVLMLPRGVEGTLLYLNFFIVLILALASPLFERRAVGFVEWLSPQLKWHECEPREAFLIYRDGRLIAHAGRQTKGLDTESVGAMLSAIQSFVQESFGSGRGEALRALRVGRYKLMIEHGRHSSLVLLFTGAASPEVAREVREALRGAEKACGAALKDWDGVLGGMAPAGVHLRKLFPLTRAVVGRPPPSPPA